MTDKCDTVICPNCGGEKQTRIYTPDGPRTVTCWYCGGAGVVAMEQHTAEVQAIQRGASISGRGRC